ncbi:putative barnase/colicin E5 family endoribonuclease, partial [Helicobacter sp. T3_23-1056]
GKGGGYQNTPAQNQNPTKNKEINEKIESNISDLVAKYKDISAQAQTIRSNARVGKTLYMTPETNRQLNALERKLKPIERELNRLETLQKFFNGTLKKDFFTPNEWNEQTIAYYRKEIEKYAGLKPIKDFGYNYAEFYKDGKGAIQKLLAEASVAKEAGQDFSGQVAGAFEKQIDGKLSDIDLVWGKITDAQKHEGYGLSHIIDKHPELDLHKIPEIIEKGEVESKNGITTIWHKDSEDKIYKLGISQGFNGKGDNKWVVTAYEVEREKDKTFGDTLFTTKRPLENPNPQTIPQNTQKHSNFMPNLDELKHFYTSAQSSVRQDINTAKDILTRKQKELKTLENNAKNAPKNRQDFFRYELIRARQEVASAQRDLTKFQQEKAYFKAQEKQLDQAMPVLKEYEQNIQSFMQNPSAKNLSPLHALKNKLYATLESTQSYKTHKSDEIKMLNSKLNDALESTLQAIDTARQNIALKKQKPSQPTPTQYFKNYIQITRNDIDYVFGNFGKKSALKSIDEKLKNPLLDDLQKRFLNRLKNEVQDFGNAKKAQNLNPSKDIDTTAQNTPAQNPNKNPNLKDEPNLFSSEPSPTNTQAMPKENLATPQTQQRYINGDYILTTTTGQNYIIPQEIAQKMARNF